MARNDLELGSRVMLDKIFFFTVDLGLDQIKFGVSKNSTKF